MNIKEIWSEKVRQFYKDDDLQELLDDISTELLEELRNYLELDKSLYGITLYEFQKMIEEIAVKLIESYWEYGKEDGYTCFKEFLETRLLQMNKYPNIYKYIEARWDFEKIDNSANT